MKKISAISRIFAVTKRNLTLNLFNMKKLALIGAIVVMMTTSCSSLKVVDQNAAANAGAAALQALTVSDAQIAQLCSQYMVETDGQNTILPASNDYTQRLNRIMARFHNISNLNLNYKVYQSNEVNAFASGDDVRDAYRAAYLMVAARYGIGAFSETAGAISQGFLGDLGQQLAQNAYSRRQETEADETAFQFCIQNGVDPYAMYHALNVLISLSGESSQQSKIAQLFSTHPNTQKRAAHVKEMCEAAGYTMTSPNPSGAKPSNGNSSGSGSGGKKKVGIKLN